MTVKELIALLSGYSDETEIIRETTERIQGHVVSIYEKLDFEIREITDGEKIVLIVK